MSKEEMAEIYTTIDNRLKKYKGEYRDYARVNGYSHFSEYLHKEYKKKKAVEIVAEMVEYGIKPISLSMIWQTQHRVKELMSDSVPPRPEDKICYMCCKRKVAKGNHALCKERDPRHRKLTVDDSFLVANKCAY